MRVPVAATLALMAALAIAVLAGSAAGAAAPAQPRLAAGAVPAPAQPSLADKGIHVSGRLVNQTNPARPKPVPGVKVTVTTAAGKAVGNATTDAKGEFSVAVPGSGEYVVRIHTDTLPAGTKLSNPKDVAHKVEVLGFDVTVLFPIGPKPTSVSTVDQLPQLFVNGLLFGLTIALASLGLSMVFGTTGLVNFAHGELITFGALVAYGFNQGLGLTVILAGVAAVIVSGVFGYAQDALFWRPLRRRGTGLIAMMIVSIGMAIFLRNLYQYIFGGDTRSFSQYTTQQPLSWFPTPVTAAGLVTMAICIVVLVIVSVALQRTRTGKATRAVADNPALASSSGIDVDRVISVVWVVGTALAGLSGILLGLSQQIDYQMGLRVLLLVFAAVTLGGLGTIWGAMLGSVVVGIFIEMSTVVVPAELKYVGAFAVLIVILLVRPQGILGRAQRVG